MNTSFKSDIRLIGKDMPTGSYAGYGKPYICCCPCCCSKADGMFCHA